MKTVILRSDLNCYKGSVEMKKKELRPFVEGAYFRLLKE